ncbi:MAG: ABC transporter permease, partial [Chloroflexota bacterium]
MRRAFAFLIRDLYVELSYRVSFLMQLAQVFIAVFVFYFISRLL